MLTYKSKGEISGSWWLLTSPVALHGDRIQRVGAREVDANDGIRYVSIKNDRIGETRTASRACVELVMTIHDSEK